MKVFRALSLTAGIAAALLTGVSLHQHGREREAAEIFANYGFPTNHRMEEVFTPEGVRSLFDEGCVDRNRQGLNEAVYEGFGREGLDTGIIHDAWTEICEPRKKELEARMDDAIPPVDALWAEPADWTAETRQGVEDYLALERMNFFSGGRYDAVWREIAKPTSTKRSPRKIPVGMETNRSGNRVVSGAYVRQVVDLLDKRPEALSDDLTYTSAIALLQAKARGLLDCAGDTRSGGLRSESSRSEMCVDQLGRIVGVGIERVQRARQKTGRRLYSLPPTHASYTLIEGSPLGGSTITPGGYGPFARFELDPGKL